MPPKRKVSEVEMVDEDEQDGIKEESNPKKSTASKKSATGAEI